MTHKKCGRLLLRSEMNYCGMEKITDSRLAIKKKELFGDFFFKFVKKVPTAITLEGGGGLMSLPLNK